MANVDDEPRFTMSEVLQVLRNVGVNVECGACAETAFTGLTTNRHTCAEHLDRAPLEMVAALSPNGGADRG